MAQWGYWVHMRNIGLHIMQALSYTLGRGLGENETGARYPVEVWQFTPENWCGVQRKSGRERLFEPPHDCWHFRLRLGFEPTWMEWVTLPNEWRSVMKQKGEVSEQEKEEMVESVVISRRILTELIGDIRSPYH